MRVWSAFSLTALFSSVVVLACQSSEKRETHASSVVTSQAPAKIETDAGRLHESFSVLLRKYVSGGKVNYAAWLKTAEDRTGLKDYLKRLSSQDPEALSENDQKSYWINAYNALTLDEVLDRFPLKSVNFDELKDPKSKGFWDSPAMFGSKTLTLNDIENNILRPKFKDPRIHFAINCASNGCPVLQTTAFEAASLDRQLDAAAQEFLNDPARGVYFDARKGVLSASPIFKWYAADFGDVIQFVCKYRSDLIGKIKRVEFQPYDWKLNEVAGGRGTVRSVGSALTK